MSDCTREARLRAHIEKRLMSCDYLLARAHGRLAAWYAGADRLAVPDANRAAIDEVNELSVTLLKVRVDALRGWRLMLATGDASLTVKLIWSAYRFQKEVMADESPPSAPSGPLPRKRGEEIAVVRAQMDEANLALGAWDGPEDTIEMMEGDRNVA